MHVIRQSLVSFQLQSRAVLHKSLSFILFYFTFFFCNADSGTSNELSEVANDHEHG